MILNNSEIEKYHQQGFLLIDSIFDSSEIDRINEGVNILIDSDLPGKVHEKTGELRTLFIQAHTNKFVDKILQHKYLLRPAEVLIGDQAYIHQIKINTKLANSGDKWEWHQDFLFWHKEDGMQKPNAINAALFLDDVNEYNGPLFLVPGSHKHGMISFNADEDNALEHESEEFKSYQKSQSYMSTLTSNLKYKVQHSSLKEMIEENGIYSAKGSRGSILFFHPNTLHASSMNLSPWDRRVFFFSYNAMSNKLEDIPVQRPQFIANRSFNKLSVSEGIL